MRFHDLVKAAENKYNRLLAILISMYLVAPFVIDTPLGNLTIFFVFLGAVILVVYQIHRTRWVLRLYIGLGTSALIMQALTYSPLTPLDFSRVLDTFGTIIILVFLSLSTYLMLRELTVTEQVTADVIKGGLCAYILIGFLWASLYELVYFANPDSFTTASSIVDRGDLTHFSFTTLTTVGYGDISPASSIARVLANLEGMVGVMYPSIFIARLVNLHGKR